MRRLLGQFGSQFLGFICRLFRQTGLSSQHDACKDGYPSCSFYSWDPPGRFVTGGQSQLPACVAQLPCGHPSRAPTHPAAVHTWHRAPAACRPLTEASRLLGSTWERRGFSLNPAVSKEPWRPDAKTFIGRRRKLLPRHLLGGRPLPFPKNEGAFTLEKERKKGKQLPTGCDHLPDVPELARACVCMCGGICMCTRVYPWSEHVDVLSLFLNYQKLLLMNIVKYKQGLNPTLQR